MNKRLTIGIDGNEANVENRVGVNTYAFNILKQLYFIEGKKKVPEIMYTIFLSSKPHSEMPSETKYWKYKILSARKFWILTRLTPYLLLNLRKFDVFFTPSHYIPPFLPIVRVCSIMDLGYLENTEQFRPYDYWQLRMWSAYSIGASKYIITISTASEADIVRHYPKRSKSIKVTQLGYDNRLYTKKVDQADIDVAKNSYSIVNDYILFLSTLKPSKNIENLIEGWARVCDKHKDVSLVIAGKKGWLFEDIFNLVKKLKIENRVVFTGFIDENLKPGLIKGAKVFALPSFWEGFGLDVLSAMASGVPVLVSDRGSLPEVAGRAGTYVNPNSIEDIAVKLNWLLSLPKKDYNKIVELGLKQASKFSWENTAEKTREILIKAARK